MTAYAREFAASQPLTRHTPAASVRRLHMDQRAIRREKGPLGLQFGVCRPARSIRWGAAALMALGCFALPSLAHAGPPPGAGGQGPLGPGVGGQAPGGDDKDGPAEAAPKDKQSLAPIEPVPAQPARARRLQIFEMHGYLRLRADYFNQLDLDVVNAGEVTPTPSSDFFLPPSFDNEPNPDPSVQVPSDVTCAARKTGNSRAQNRCGNRKPGIAGANMRLRLDPTIHVTDTIRVHTTLDLLDNLALGSTPEFSGPLAGMNLFSRSAVAPISGVNSVADSITVKRAWGHARFGWGLDLRFGRMPLQWGMGMVFNDGNGIYRGQRDDIIRMVDTDYGDSIDSVQLGYHFGKDQRKSHHVFAAYDWAASGPSTVQLLGPDWDAGANVAAPLSVEQTDNVHQFRLGIERRDDPDMLRRKLSLGGPVVNYGAMTSLRFQTTDRALYAPDPVDADDAFDNYAEHLVLRNAIVATPDIWFRVNWRTLRVEFETAGVFGKFDHADFTTDPDDLAAVRPQDMQTSRLAQFGYALEFKYGLFDDDFHIGFDHGFALGDDRPSLGYDDRSPLSEVTNSGQTLTAFRFNPAYMSDLLLFREIMGTASNAVYFRPWAAYHFFKGNFSARLDVQYALAQSRAQTPGNKLNYGVEIDGALRYHDTREPIFFQFQYGVLFPFGAFDARAVTNTGTGSVRAADAKAAQAVQAQLGIRF